MSAVTGFGEAATPRAGAGSSWKAASGRGEPALEMRIDQRFVVRWGLLLVGALVAVLVCLGPAVGPASAAQGDLDPSFHGDGKLITDADPFNGEKVVNDAQGVAVQGDGKIVAVGRGSTSSSLVGQLVRYNRDGSLDAGFGVGGNGKVTIPESYQFLAFEVALQSDGKIVITGRGFDQVEGRTGLAVIRYSQDGTLDTSFGGGDGIVVADVPPPGGGESPDVLGYDVAIQPDGKIVAAGVATAVNFGSSSSAAVIARFTPDGERDATFGTGGQQTVGIGAGDGFDEDVGLVLQPDGKSVIAARSIPADGGGSNFFLARFTTLGTRDPSFGSAGVVVTPNFSGGGSSPKSFDGARDVALQRDGKIVAVGFSKQTFTAPRDFALARYNTDGSLDKGFDGDGKVLTDAGGSDSAEAVALQSDGKIVAVGSNPSEFAPEMGRVVGGDFVLFRYKGDGSLDSGFGQAGKVTTPFGPNYDNAEDVAIQPTDGKIVAAGFTSHDGSADFEDFALARYQGEPPAAGGGGGGGGNSPPPPTGGNPPPPAGPGGGGGPAPPKGKGCVNSAGVKVLGKTNSGGRVIQGSKANDRICGTSRGDVITGNGGKDVISGFGGNDRINGGSGSDRINGGSGKDRISGSSGNDVISGSSGNDRINGNSGKDRINGNSGKDRINGNSGKDRINGNSGKDRINGNSGNDRLAGASGNDVISGSSGKDVISGGSGNDRLSGNSGNDRLNGDSGNDRISGGSGNDRLKGSSGNDRISGGSGRDSLSGGSGRDSLRGDSGNDRLSGGSGKDKLSGGSGKNNVKQ